MKELVKGNMQIRCNKKYLSISPHSIGSVNDKKKKENIYEET